MENTRYEEYSHKPGEPPFVLYTALERTPLSCSREKNWHENIEIELCVEGEGTVLINGTQIPIREGDMIVINSGELHYTTTQARLVYDCLIVDTAFCRQFGFDYRALRFRSLVRDTAARSLFRSLVEEYDGEDRPFRAARLGTRLLRLLIFLGEAYATRHAMPTEDDGVFHLVKEVLKLVQTRYRERLSLDEIARTVLCDKYELCRAFKRMTGQTVVEYIQNYRCARAAELLDEGMRVAEAAEACGFGNPSFFAEVFGRRMGMSPTAYRKRTRNTRI